MDGCGTTIVVCGTARCLWDDMEKLSRKESFSGWDNVSVMTVNQAVMHLGRRVDHAYSNHGDLLEHWLAVAPDVNGKPQGHTCYDKGNGLRRWPWEGHGTSSLNAVYTVLALEFDRVILCGIPLDDSGHYYDPPRIGSNFTNEVPDRNGGLRYWKDARQSRFGGRVSSMSGRTRDLLGEPQ